MPGEAILRDKARTAIRQGKLPARRVGQIADQAMPRSQADLDSALIVRAKLALGRLRRDACTINSVIELGCHRICDGCDRPISATEAEMRAQFADGTTLRFHAPCFATWYTETQRSGR